MRHGSSRLQGLVGAIKDKASQTKATLLLPLPASFHLPLLRSTTHSPSCPPDPRHLDSLLLLAHSSRSSASSLVSALMDRLVRTRSSPVALKCLFAFHYFLRRGPFILLDQLSFLPLHGGRNYLNLSGFRDDSTPLYWELSCWVRWYAAYLEHTVSASRTLGHYFLNYSSDDIGGEGARVSGFTNRDLLDEIESLAGLVEETCRIPEPPHSRNDNPIIRLVKEFVLDDFLCIAEAISVRVDEFAQRLDCLTFTDCGELVCSLKRLESCRERALGPFDCDEKASVALRRVWDSIGVVRGGVGAGKKMMEVEVEVAVRRAEDGVGCESARFRGPVLSLRDSVRFSSGRLGFDHT